MCRKPSRADQKRRAHDIAAMAERLRAQGRDVTLYDRLIALGRSVRSVKE